MGLDLIKGRVVSKGDFPPPALPDQELSKTFLLVMPSQKFTYSQAHVFSPPSLPSKKTGRCAVSRKESLSRGESSEFCKDEGRISLPLPSIVRFDD